MNTSTLNEITQATEDCNAVLIRLQSIILARADQGEVTSTVLSSIQKVSWGIQDAHEFKTRQILVNCDENVLNSIPGFITFVRTLTSETNEDVTCLMQSDFPTDYLPTISSKFSSITPVLYRI